MVSLQSFMVLLLHLLHIDVLHIYGNDAGFINTKLPTSCHYKFFHLHDAKFVLWIYNPATGKPSFFCATHLQICLYASARQRNLQPIIVLLQQIPKWWTWLYYLMPTSWTLNGMLSSQYGDIEKEILVFGETKTVSTFLTDYFGFHRDRLPLVGAMLILYPILFASIFAYAIGRFNFQRR